MFKTRAPRAHLSLVDMGDTMQSVGELPAPTFRQEVVLDRADNAIRQIGDNVVWQLGHDAWVTLLRDQLALAETARAEEK